MSRDRIPWCRVCGLPAPRCREVAAKTGDPHEYEGDPWTPPAPPAKSRPGRRQQRPPGGWPRPYKD